MRTLTLLTAMWLAVALPAHATPPDATTPPPQDAHAQAPASHSRIGAMMGSLTRALREAAEQQKMQARHATTMQANASDASTTTQTSAASLPDATAQAAVP